MRGVLKRVALVDPERWEAHWIRRWAGRAAGVLLPGVRRAGVRLRWRVEQSRSSPARYRFVTRHPK